MTRRLAALVIAIAAATLVTAPSASAGSCGAEQNEFLANQNSWTNGDSTGVQADIEPLVNTTSGSCSNGDLMGRRYGQHGARRLLRLGRDRLDGFQRN